MIRGGRAKEKIASNEGKSLEDFKAYAQLQNYKFTGELQTRSGTAHVPGVMRWMVTGCTRTDRDGDRDSFYTKKQLESVKLC